MTEIGDATKHLIGVFQALEDRLVATADGIGAGYASISISWTRADDGRLCTASVSIGEPDDEDEEEG